jgi:sugar lactone lactonase YvrE
MKVRMALVLMILALLVACQQQSETPAPETTDTTPTAPPEPTALTEGFQTPESVLYDAEQDVYFVSNINGDPGATDDNGFISRVNAETLQVESKWIDGSKAEITLNAPKGLAIVGEDLYVADITTVRKFDRKTGAAKGEVKLPRSTFVNDLVSDGAIAYASDTGVKFEAGKPVPTGTDAIWKIDGTKATKIASGKDLTLPNGLTVVGGTVWAVSFGGAELYPIENGKKGAVTTLPTGGLDGLVAMPDGSVMVTSWDGKTVYRGKPGEAFQAAIENIDAPADLGFDSKRNRVLVPHFMESRVTIHPVQ